MNPNSLTVIKEAYVEPELEKYDKEDSFQFMRTGYFCLDSKDSTKEYMVFNRIVSLKFLQTKLIKFAVTDKM